MVVVVAAAPHTRNSAHPSAAAPLWGYKGLTTLEISIFRARL